QMLRRDGSVVPIDREDPDGEDPPIRTRFVVDILSGSSAGGINAIFLATAIANQLEIDDPRGLGIKAGDIGDLVNDAAWYRDIPDLKPQSPPRSLLNSGRLYIRA